MQTGNNQYVITVSGERFTAFSVQEVLPEVLVKSANELNPVSQVIILVFLQRTHEHTERFASVKPRLRWTDLSFIAKEYNV